MTDKVQKIRDEIKKQRQLIWPKNTGEMRVVDVPKPSEQGWLNALKWMEGILDSLQEEPSKFDDAIQKGDDVRYNEDLGCRVNLSQLKRVAKKDSRYCMYSKDNYTDKDRKVLCGDCEEVCEFNKKEEPVSEMLEEEIDIYLATRKWREVNETFSADRLIRFATHFANWQKEQINEALLSEVLPCFMHGGEADEVVAKLEEVLNQK